MGSDKNLGAMIAAHMSLPGDIAEQKPETDFVLSSLRAAIFSNPVTRRKILSNVADILGCHGEDLEFLYNDVNEPAPIMQCQDIMVPEYRAQLRAVAK